MRTYELQTPRNVGGLNTLRHPQTTSAQVDHILVERLQATWQKGLLAGAE